MTSIDHDRPRRARRMGACRAWTLFLVVAIRAGTVSAQEPSHAFGLAIDLGATTVRDDSLVPLAFTGPRLGLGPRYAGVLGPGSLHAQLHLAAALVLDREGRAGLGIDHGLNVHYVIRLSQAPGLQHAVGPALGWDTDLALPAAWDDAHAYWIASRWLGVAWHGILPGSRGRRWEFTAELPCVALLSRPPGYRSNKQDALTELDFYFDDVQSDPQWASFLEYQQLRFTVDYWHTLAKGAAPDGWALGLEARATHANEPQDAYVLRLTARFIAAWGW